MWTLVFVCPTTGHEVSTGVEVDRLSFKSLPRTKTAIFSAVVRIICSRLYGLGWSTGFRKIWTQTLR